MVALNYRPSSFSSSYAGFFMAQEKMISVFLLLWSTENKPCMLRICLQPTFFASLYCKFWAGPVCTESIRIFPSGCVDTGAGTMWQEKSAIKLLIAQMLWIAWLYVEKREGKSVILTSVLRICFCQPLKKQPHVERNVTATKHCTAESYYDSTWLQFMKPQAAGDMLTTQQNMWCKARWKASATSFQKSELVAHVGFLARKGHQQFFGWPFFLLVFGWLFAFLSLLFELSFLSKFSFNCPVNFDTDGKYPRKAGSTVWTMRRRIIW